MNKRVKADIKISLWRDEIEKFKQDINNAKEQMFMWRGVEKGYSEALESLNNIFRLTRISMNWATLKKKEKEYYEELGKKWPHLAKKEQITEYKKIIENWDELDEIAQKKKLKSCPVKKPKVELSESEGFNVIRFLEPMQSTYHACIRMAKSEPEKFKAQMSILQRQIDRLEAMIKIEKSKDFNESPLGEDDKDVPLGDDKNEPL